LKETLFSPNKKFAGIFHSFPRTCRLNISPELTARFVNMDQSEVTNAVYGLIGLGALVAIKYFYPSLKKFFKRRFGNQEDVDANFRQQLALNLPEINRMMGNVPITSSGGGGIP
jgi:hypothetical protein